MNKNTEPKLYKVIMLPDKRWAIQHKSKGKNISKPYSYFDTYASDLMYIIVNKNCEVQILRENGSVERVITSQAMETR